jgi:plasmid maintenance system antidote protein VapI
MSDQNPISLDAQVVARVRQFLQSTNISQRWLARQIGSDPGNFSAFLSGAKSLAATKMAKLLEILGLDRMQLQAKFSPSVTARIEHFQSDGKPMKLDASSWVPGQSGTDPNDGASIIDDDDPDTTEAFLLKQIEIHKAAIGAISDYLVKVKVNKTGSTEPARTVTGTRKPGPKPDLYRVTDRKAHLVYLHEQREKAETALQLEKDIKAEREAAWNAQKQLKGLRG